MDRNNIIAFALSMLVFAGYLGYQNHQRERFEEAQKARGQVVVAATPEPGTTGIEATDGCSRTARTATGR